VNDKTDDFDPLAPETFDSPHVVYGDLRSRCPVAHSNAWNGFWALMKYEDVKRAATKSKVFITSVQNVVPKVAFSGRRPPLHLDPPAHTPYRAALNRLFDERKLRQLEPRIRRHAGELLEPLIARGHADICGEFSSHLPVLVFAEWMNLPPDKVQMLRIVGRNYNVAVQSADDAVTKETSLQLYEIARELVAERKREPLDPEEDATSALLAARYDGEPLPDEMIVGCVRQVLVVGIIAPTVVIGSIVVHLSRHPELQSKLRSNLELVPAALEEFLRLYTPYRGFARTATEAVEIRGRRIEPGEPVALVYAAPRAADRTARAAGENRVVRSRRSHRPDTVSRDRRPLRTSAPVAACVISRRAGMGEAPRPLSRYRSLRTPTDTRRTTTPCLQTRSANPSKSA
jgi:cytochrome P450